ncbi:hypothetical protein SAMN04488055_1779 [Chitinophaga niabensis]|uniref:Uncharacterized protein n=1 Tax=Chitinophaga niabensis TaxID=536979 RepID=A0A1N6ER73_9BACT|nr:hypothetical protein SAMN04488055_1779 [Chitinophaga niabensis]
MDFNKKPLFNYACSILVVNKKGELKSLFCPFGVITIAKLDDIPPDTRMIVEEVNTNLQDIIIYVINGKPYFHWHFQILMQF